MGIFYHKFKFQSIKTGENVKRNGLLGDVFNIDKK